MPSIYFPPWAGGRFPLREQGTFEASQPPVACCPVCFLPTEQVVEGGKEHRALRGRVERYLGHGDNLLRQREVKTLQDDHRLVDHLRHSNVESR